MIWLLKRELTYIYVRGLQARRVSHGESLVCGGDGWWPAWPLALVSRYCSLLRIFVIVVVL
jgi:hypothetical protein